MSKTNILFSLVAVGYGPKIKILKYFLVYKEKKTIFLTKKVVL